MSTHTVETQFRCRRRVSTKRSSALGHSDVLYESAFNLTLFPLMLSMTAKRLFSFYCSHTVVIDCFVLADISCDNEL